MGLGWYGAAMARVWWRWWVALLRVTPVWARERTPGEWDVEARLGGRWIAGQPEPGHDERS